MTEHTISAHAKWILAGEHAVVRGGRALVMPLLDYTLNIHSQSCHGLKVSCEHGDAQALLFEGLIDNVCERFDQDPKTLNEHLHLTYNIPTGKGLGFSSALCVSMAKWAHHKGWLHALDITRFAQSLEHQFHGKSSGVDIIGSSSDQPVLYQKGVDPIVLPPLPTACWILVDTGSKSLTKTAVNNVQAWFDNNPGSAQAVDAQMDHSVQMAYDYLTHPTPSITPLIEAMEMAQMCFRTWHLIPETVDHYIETLKSWGALAVKPTGAGLGGLLISLWQRPPSAEQLATLPWHHTITTTAYEEVS